MDEGLMASWHVVAKVGAVRAGDVIAIEAAGVQMILGLDGDRYFAMQRQCLHRGGDLSDGIIARGHVVCANHGWRFSTATGCHDSASDVCLRTYPVRISGDDIEVELQGQS
jgi:nitrite reductase/ring-hydroxylating ferredoxin subunit